MGNVNKQRRNLISFFVNLDMGLGIPLQESRLHLTKYVSGIFKTLKSNFVVL